MKAEIICFFIIITLLNQITSEPKPFSLNEAIKGSLSDKTYVYYSLKLPKLDLDSSKFLLIEARRNEEQDIIDNVFSDPNIYISTTEVYPGPDKNTWSSSRFGDEIISINKNHVKTGSIFYISIYCEFKCNYILDAKIYNSYKMKEDKLYTISMIEDDVIKGTFKSRKNFNKLTISCVSSRMKPFRIFLAKKDPSSSNTLYSQPIFINGYYFLIQKGDENYSTEQEYEILIENKEFKQDLLFWIIYDNEDMELSELSPLFGNASPNSGNCYYFTIDKLHQNKNIIISTTLFNGNGYIKIGGWEKVKNMKIIREDNNTYPIISDKSILLTETNFKDYGAFNNSKSKDLHFCFIASEETSYTIKIYYEENAEQAQKLNYLLPGIANEDMLPGKTLTTYRLFYFEQNKDIKIELKGKNGSPKLYLFYSHEDNNYINKDKIELMIKNQTLINATEIGHKKYTIQIEKIDNKCIYEHKYGDTVCKIFAVVDCQTDANCLYELKFDHVGEIVNMKPKVIYSNVITEKEIDKYRITISDEKIRNFAVILSQNTGNVKLKFSKFISEAEINFENSEKFNKEYMPNIIEVKSKDFPAKNIKGSFDIEVIGYSFSSYNIYYYTFDDDNSSKLDHKTITMNLIKGNLIKDYIKDNHNIKIYSYDNSNVGKEKSDLFIFFDTPSLDVYFKIYVFKNLNDYNYENEKIKGFLWESQYYDVLHIEKDDPNYIIGNLYIMIVLTRFYNYENVVFRKESSIESSFLLGITDENTPLTLIEGVEFGLSLTSKRLSQTFYYNHHNKDEDFILSISIPYSKVKIGLKIGEKDYIYEKIINSNYYLQIESKDISYYCLTSKYCNIEIKINAIDIPDLDDMKVNLLCKSSKNAIVYLTKNGQIEKRRIAINEKQFYVVEIKPADGDSIKINAIFKYGRGILYAKKADKNTLINQSFFPDASKYEYISSLMNNEEISILNIPYEDIKNDVSCRILVTVQKKSDFLGKNEGEYSISVSNIIDDIFPNKNYRLLSLKGEIKYYRFTIKGGKKRLSISMTNKEVDAYMYLNYGNLIKNMDFYQWKSEGSYNEYIDISIDDPYFVSRKINSLDGEYYLAIRSFQDTYFNLFISDLDIKIMTITEEFPGTCLCEKEDDMCYFRYENINNPEIAEVMEKELIFYFDFTYGSAEIYASLFPNGNNGLILKSLPTKRLNDYKSSYSNEYLKIKLTPGKKKYTLDSVLILGTKCKTKSMFDFNVRPLLKSGTILSEYESNYYLGINQDNIIYISKNSLYPVKLVYYSITNLPITYQARAISGSAKIHCYRKSDESYELNEQKINGFKHISEFSVDEKDTTYYYDSISSEDIFKQNLVFEIKAKDDCLFSIYLHYSEDVLFLPMSKRIQAKFDDELKFFGYIELLKEYEEVIISVDKMHSESKYSIYAKTSIVNSLNFKKMFSYSAPSTNNYDVKATSNSFSPSLNIKINNIPKEYYTQGKKVITIFYIEPENRKSFNDKLSMIAYPNVDHFELIYPQPYKYIYSSLTSVNVDKTVFSFKQQEKENNLLIIEISACKGGFWYDLTSDMTKKNERQNSYLLDGKGKTLIVSKIENNKEYYLSIKGIKEDEIILTDINNNDSKDIDFLLYYYTSNDNDFNQNKFDSKITYEIKKPGNVLLKLPDLENIYSQNTKLKLEDLTVSLILTDNPHEFNYMDSICYLSKKYEDIQSHELYKNITIDIRKNKNEIEIDKLNKSQNYYLNVLLTNKKTEQLMSLHPLQILPDKKIITKKNILVILLIIAIIILTCVSFYFYRKYRIAKAIVNYEKNDIKNMGTIPKSITELKKIQEEKNKKAKERYNSLTEDSGEI